MVTVTGPKGTLTYTVAEPITVERAEDGTLSVVRPDDQRESRSLHGLTRSLVANMVTGVTAGYTKAMEIRGVGYRVAAKDGDLEFALGYSHPVPVAAPDGISFAVTSPTRAGPSVRTRGTQVRYIARETAAYLYYEVFGRGSDSGQDAL